MPKTSFVEWPTLALFLVVYLLWAIAVFWLAEISPAHAIPVAGLSIAFHGSLQHEAIHGHPTRWSPVNTALAFPPVSIVVPFTRFRDTHLAHHQDADLTDPYDDPETNYMTAADWAALPGWQRVLLGLNNTLAGRLIVGPAIGTLCFIRCDWARGRENPGVRAKWLWHWVSILPVLALVWASPMPLWAYALAVYVALALLRIRTFLEHQAHEQTRARSVIIEDRGPLAFLFLNNNLHAVHHAHPQVPWYKLPALYRSKAPHFIAMNGGYRFASYGEIFRRYFLRRKDPVVHPLKH